MSSMRFAALSVCILIFVGVATAGGNKGCIWFCTKEYRPVCGRNSDGDHNAFSNECEMKNYNCVHPESEYELLYNGTCTQEKRSEDCPVVCPLFHQPVCGQNRQGELLTFVNDCVRKLFNCRHPESSYSSFRQGSCEHLENEPQQTASSSKYKGIQDCPQTCPFLYQPVCGENPQGDRLTFDNDCVRLMYNCRDPESSYATVRPGTCEAHALDECPDVCPAIYKPLCARNPSGRRLTFSNECALEVYNCQTSSAYERVRDGYCDQPTEENCPFCQKLIRPVCGENGDGDRQTFPNECELRRYNCRNTEPKYELLHEGRCAQQKRKEYHEECPMVCNFLYRPLCGSNPQGHHRTFGNECEMKRYNCRNSDSKYGYLHSGTC